jgi:Outer membrane efflux protein
VETKPTVTVNFAKGTSSVPLDLVVGKVVAGRWNVYLEATIYPGWTSPPSTDYKLTLNVGYLFPSPFQAYDAVLRAQRALEIREEALKACRELDRLTVEQAARGEAAPSVVLQARAARARATSDVVSARQELGGWTRQLNHLMGRDAQARLFVTREPGPTPATAIRLGATATGQ